MRNLSLILGILIFSPLFLLSCAAGDHTETAVPATAIPTSTRQPVAVNTPEPTVTPTGPPTDTPSPTPWPTDELPPTSTPVPSATFTPTPLPRDVEAALQLMDDGYVSPVALVAPDDGTGRLFVADQTGVVYVLDADGKRLPEPLIDVSNKIVQLDVSYDERGLLGIVLHPEFARNGRFYLYYSAPRRPSAPSDWDHTSHLSEFTISTEDPNRADLDSERIIMYVDQPQPNHNGGQIEFGLDGYLYLGLGDGGNWADVGIGHPPEGNGQAMDTLLGSIVRIDVDSDLPYTIPADNPFVGQDGILPEIYAYGFRNPFRFSFDKKGDNALYVGDVGQDFIEEIDQVVRGGNYGWPVREGTTCFNIASVSQPLETCDSQSQAGAEFLAPVIEYGRDVGRSTLGGYVYRGSAIPELYSRYIFLDWVGNQEIAGRKIYYADTNQPADAIWEFYPVPLVMADGGSVPAFYSLSFGEDVENELYLLTTDVYNPVGTSGKVYKIVPID